MKPQFIAIKIANVAIHPTSPQKTTARREGTRRAHRRRGRPARGIIEKWLIGGPAINRLEAKGWTKTTVKPGDTITGIGYQFADGQKIIRLERAVLADGREMLLYASR